VKRLYNKNLQNHQIPIISFCWFFFFRFFFLWGGGPAEFLKLIICRNSWETKILTVIKCSIS
jgi:hypothetical protein